MNYKIHVKSSEESEAIQEHAFKLGYVWYKGVPKAVTLTTMPYLLFENKDLCGMAYMYSGKDTSLFESNPATEITVEQFLTLTEVGGEIKVKICKTTKLKEDIEDMKNKLNSMENTLDEMEKNAKDSGWYNSVSGGIRAKFGINSRGEVYITKSCKELKENCNLFSSKEKAERIAFEQLLWRKMQRFADENNVEFGDIAFYIYFNMEETLLKVSHHVISRDFGGIHFSSEELAQKAIDLNKEDLIKYFKGRN